ncbi:MAG: glycosyltransferase [Ilumatobacteraceae bacterium]|nr:glycosyltransferase [Ilumatobacteraceae bacterium]
MTATAVHRPLVSAAIIVRDEAAALRRCLSSIAGWCDELVVVDTGSVDDSVAVAAEFGAVQGTFPWIDDFAAARNHALDLVSGEWVLYIDADEVIEPVERDVAHAELHRHPTAVALRLWMRTRAGFSPFREFRLWRNRPDVRFTGRIHETTVPDLLRISAAEDLPIDVTEVFRLTHDGYDHDQSAKHRRNLPMLRARLAEPPERCYLWNHLGEVLAAVGEHDEAEQAWQSGIDLIRRRGLVDRSDVLCYTSLCMHRLDRGHEVSGLIDELDAVAPWCKSTPWMRAVNHRRQGRHADAIAPLRELIAIGPDTLDETLSYNNNMFTHWAWEALADSLQERGDLAAAADVMSEAAAAFPDRLDYRTRSIALRSMASNDHQA